MNLSCFASKVTARTLRKQALCGWLACGTGTWLACLATASGGLVHQWTFNDGTPHDAIGTADGVGYHNPVIREGKLILDGTDQGVITGPLERTLSNRTVVVWLTVSDLTQQGAAAFTLAAESAGTLDGVEYSGIRPGRWNTFSEENLRTQLPGELAGCPAETNKGRLMLAAVYGDGHPDRIKLYRNATLYADFIPQHPHATYTQGLARAWFGLRPTPPPAQGNRSEIASRSLAGAIDEARIYDHALSTQEIARLHARGPAPMPASVPLSVFLMILLLAAPVTGVLVVKTRNYRRRLASLERRSALSAERSRIARDMHDELGANLTRVKLLSELIERDAGSLGRASGYARRVSRIVLELARSMDEIVWAVNPNKDRVENFVIYLGSFVEELLGVTHLRYRLDLPDSASEIPLPAEVRHHLFLAAKEALHNTVKHSHATEVRVRLALADGRMEITVQDDGRGFSPGAGAPKGNGLGNMAGRLTRIGGTCIIRSQPGQGTEVKLTIPLPPHGSVSHV